MKKTITEIKNTLENINSMLGEVEEQINDFKVKVAENTHSKQHTKDFKKQEQFKGHLGQFKT